MYKYLRVVFPKISSKPSLVTGGVSLFGVGVVISREVGSVVDSVVVASKRTMYEILEDVMKNIKFGN